MYSGFVPSFNNLGYYLGSRSQFPVGLIRVIHLRLVPSFFILRRYILDSFPVSSFYSGRVFQIRSPIIVNEIIGN